MPKQLTRNIINRLPCFCDLFVSTFFVRPGKVLVVQRFLQFREGEKMDAQSNRSPAGVLVFFLFVITMVMAFLNAPQLIKLVKASNIPPTGVLATTPTPLAPTSEASAAEKTRVALEETTRVQQALATQVESKRQLDQVVIQATEQAAQATRQAWQATAEVNLTTVEMARGLAEANSTQVAVQNAKVEMAGRTKTMEAVLILAVGVTVVIIIMAVTWSIRTQQDGRQKEYEAAAQKLEQQRLLEESRRQAATVKIGGQPQPQRKNGHYNTSKIPARMLEPEDGSDFVPPISYAE
jgi:hypothetical protein